MTKSKRSKNIANSIDVKKKYSVNSAIKLIKSCPSLKFVETVDISLNLGIDTTKPEQQVRGVVELPSGLGKNVRIAVITSGKNLEIAKEAGADFCDEDLDKKILGGWTDFDVLITTPEMMRKVGALGRILGPRGLMPSPKADTVTTNIEKAIKSFKMGKIELKSNRNGSVHAGIGKVNMSEEELVKNTEAVIKSVIKLKPATASGKYIGSIYLSSTMGPGIKIDVDNLY